MRLEVDKPGRRSVVAWRGPATAFVCTLFAFRAFGLKLQHRLSQNASTVCSSMLSGQPSVMAQTIDGYIWLGKQRTEIELEIPSSVAYPQSMQRTQGQRIEDAFIRFQRDQS